MLNVIQGKLEGFKGGGWAYVDEKKGIGHVSEYWPSFAIAACRSFIGFVTGVILGHWPGL